MTTTGLRGYGRQSHRTFKALQDFAQAQLDKIGAALANAEIARGFTWMGWDVVRIDVQDTVLEGKHKGDVRVEIEFTNGTRRATLAHLIDYGKDYTQPFVGMNAQQVAAKLKEMGVKA